MLKVDLDRNEEKHLKLNELPPSGGLTEFNRHRDLLFSMAYRMLGSVADAEDMLQETFIRWQQIQHDSIRSPRAFLVTIISRLCINHLQSARVQREEYSGQWLPEPIMTGAGSDPLGEVRIGESLSIAFMVMLERLTPTERAVFLLREVFEYEYAEIAEIVGQNEVSCRQILRRARQRVSAIRPRFKASSQKQNDLLRRFLEALGTGDMEGLLALLSKDAVLYADGGGKAAAVPNRVSGAGKVARGVLGGFRKFVPANLKRYLTQINGGPGVISYVDGRPYSVVTLDIEGEQVRGIYVLTNPNKLAHLPDFYKFRGESVTKSDSRLS